MDHCVTRLSNRGALRGGAVALLAACALAHPLAAQARAAEVRYDTGGARSRQVDSLFAPWAARAGPGVAVLVMRNGRVLHLRGYGLADVAARAPITPATRFELASLSKQVTAMAVMMLAERRQLTYRDPLTRWFPRFAAHARGVQVRDLLGHTSGIPDYIEEFRARGPAYTAFPRARRGDSPVHEPSMAEMIDTLAAQPPRFPPGVGWEYDNSGYLLAAAIVEKVSGQPFPAFVEENVFRPLGMRASSFVTDGPGAGPRARSYQKRADGAWEALEYTPLEQLYGAVGVVTTLEDLARWYAALDAGTLVRRDVQDEAFTTGYLEGGQPTGYGFGWVLGETLGQPRAAHGGWWKGFRNIALRYPRAGLTVVILSNDEAFAPLRNEMAYRAARIYIRDALVFPPRVALAPAELQRLAGTYVSGRDSRWTVAAHGAALRVTTPAGPALRLIPFGPRDFYVDGVEEQRFRFVPDADGMGMRMMRMEYGLGTTVQSWIVARR